MAETAAKTKITPDDNGRRMSLAEFEHAELQEGYVYELGRGVVVMGEVPNPSHLLLLEAIRRQFGGYVATHPESITVLASGSDCKILLQQFESERHPDLSVYLTPPPADNSTAWQSWIPEIVIEIVSPGSEQRDYVEKREEYLQFGVREYWIFNRDKKEVLVLRRSRGQWQETLITAGRFQTPLLPGFEFDVRAAFPSY